MFLQTAANTFQSSESALPFLGAVAGAIAIISFIISIGLYIYLSLAYMSIGKKAGLKSPGLAWIPGIGPVIVAFQASKMHWWPWLLLIGLFISFLNAIVSIAFAVFAIVWNWKMFEAIDRPGWWAIMQIIPVVGLIFLGIAAWGEASKK